MKPEEIFLQMMKPKIKLIILKVLKEKKKLTIKNFQCIFSQNSKDATQTLWELCNHHLVEKYTCQNVCFFKLTELGYEYLLIIERLLSWSDEHQINGGYLT